jgi:two-component system, OmpR family, KDP operon response regulator KdpE
VSSAAKVLIVDDELAIRRLLRTALERARYRVVDAANAREAMAAVSIDKPDAVLLDLGLPDRDGLELVPLIKQLGPALLVVSAREATDEKVAALDLGADDYITKPFDSEEVLARIRTALRHRLTTEAEAPVVKGGGIVIDIAARRVTRRGEEVHLTPKEYGFLAELAKHPGRVVTHAQLLRAVWGPAHANDVEYLRVAARGVRKKLEADPASPSLIVNEPGVGYRLVL